MGLTCTVPSTSADRCAGHSKGPLPHSPVRHKHTASHWTTSATSIQPSTASHWEHSHQKPFSYPLYHTGNSATNTHSAIHCITLGTQPTTSIQPSTVSHWALSHQHPFSQPLSHTGHSVTNTHSANHCITLGTQSPTPIQPSTVSHWALSHQEPLSHPLHHTGHSATNSHSGSLGQPVQDGHLDSHTAPELCCT